MTLGLKRGTVALFPHESAWEAEAARTIALLQQLLGDAACDLRHVGSTSVKTIRAKPIIDIAVAARDFDAVLSRADALALHGFFYRPDSADDTQLLFACGSYYTGEGDLQTHFIHVVRAGGVQWRNYLNFSAYLNAFPAAAEAYEALKLRLAAECPVDEGRARYLAGKHGFITHTLRKATVWALLGSRVRIRIDRPLGYARQTGTSTMTYPVNYGYLPGVPGGDGEDLDVYLLGVDTPVTEAECVVVGVVHRQNDVEDKLIAAPAGTDLSAAEMAAAVRFQEQWFDSDVIPLADAADFETRYEKG